MGTYLIPSPTNRAPLPKASFKSGDTHLGQTRLELQGWNANECGTIQLRVLRRSRMRLGSKVLPLGAGYMRHGPSRPI